MSLINNKYKTSPVDDKHKISLIDGQNNKSPIVASIHEEKVQVNHKNYRVKTIIL